MPQHRPPARLTDDKLAAVVVLGVHELTPEQVTSLVAEVSERRAHDPADLDARALLAAARLTHADLVEMQRNLIDSARAHDAVDSIAAYSEGIEHALDTVRMRAQTVAVPREIRDHAELDTLPLGSVIVGAEQAWQCVSRVAAVDDPDIVLTLWMPTRGTTARPSGYVLGGADGTVTLVWTPGGDQR